MEINVTAFVKSELIENENATDYSCSQMERGSYAGEGSYNHAKEQTEDFCIVNDETRTAIIDYFEGFGAWERDEMEAWTTEELNGLCLQYLAGEYKEWGIGEEDSTIFETEDGEYYFYFGM